MGGAHERELMVLESNDCPMRLDCSGVAGDPRLNPPRV